MKSRSPTSFEFYYQVVGLILSVIVVHVAYSTVIRPHAQADQTLQAELQAADPSHEVERSLYIVVRDYEQEICIVLMFWALAIMGYKAARLGRECKLLQQDLLQIDEGMRVLPEDARDMTRQLELLKPDERGTLLPRTLTAALHRFSASQNVQGVSEVARNVCESEGERLESELSMIRYIAWAIPSIGFIGTVRGIGDALGKAHQAIEGDISGVTESLGVAFNSTLIALVISIVLVFFMHQLQLVQERFILNAEAYCEENLIRHLHTR
jgi:biopolymer transport protein ExbB/TolQ